MHKSSATQWIALGAAIATTVVSAPAWAQAAPQQEPTTPPPQGEPSTPPPQAPDDPTGGAYASPTLLFVPAGAVPAWTARAILSTEVQGPSDVNAGVRPGVGGELGLPGGVTVGAGTNWVGGDVNPATGATDFNQGLSPYVQARLHLIGDASGRGFQLGTSATYKFVGFEGDPGEGELGISAQYRARRYEVGLQGNFGKDFASTSADAEAHAYALYRIIPQLGVGAAGQARLGIVSQPGDTAYDVLGGAIAILTLGRYQIGALGGASTLGLAQGQAGALGQLFATARF